MYYKGIGVLNIAQRVILLLLLFVRHGRMKISYNAANDQLPFSGNGFPVIRFFDARGYRRKSKIG